ncbi:hypothetical protein HPB48_004851 [Haemaphysalis longicornis]|uniref:DDE Tnp4 domain-containing protein n=1 Tax=Haemaphysalis longicornis TaxID=44386 RepID=A0A9J6GNW9_HAELO|nr:hypothetical protein HPB48_004851 [Haemaphysalis longicornis]
MLIRRRQVNCQPFCPGPLNGEYVCTANFCDVVVELLQDKWVKMPTADRLADHITAFSAVCDFPQAVGALDGLPFSVSPPKEFAVDYYNYKGWHSMVLLALVDHRYRFLYTNVGSRGRCHDASFTKARSWRSVWAARLSKFPVATINETAVPPLILCDQAFPLTAHLIKTF